MLNPAEWLKDRHHRWLVAILGAGLLTRTMVALLLPIGFDEAYYYIYSQHLNWSYFDHPLLVAFTTGFGTWLTGIVNPLTVRLATLLLYSGSLLFLYKTAARLFHQEIALITLGIASLVPIFSIAFGILTMPDTPLLFFWMATLWLASIEFFQQPADPISHKQVYRPTYRVAIIGLLIGLACLGKYHGFLLGAGLVGFCLTSDTHRRALGSPWILLSAVLFALAIAPLLYWNNLHEWASFRFQSSRAVPNASYNWETFVVTWLVHMVYLFPAFGFPLVWSIGRAIADQVKQPAAQLRQRFVLWLSVPIILGFMIIAGYQQVLPSWPMAAYMTATILLAERSHQWFQKYPRRFWNWLIISGVIIQLLYIIALSHLAWGTFQKPSHNAIGDGLLTLEQDNSIQMIDISQLQRGLKNSTKVMLALERSDFVFTNRYFPSGQVAMALHSLTTKPLTCFDLDLRGFAYWSHPQEWVGKNALYIGSETFQVTADIHGPLGHKTPGYEPLDRYFQEIKELATIPIYRGGIVTQTWRVYEARQMLKPYPRPYGLGQD
jgi:4-amino-4-deoxy-L-arabinose transferase-like glycosyltransferase